MTGPTGRVRELVDELAGRAAARVSDAGAAAAERVAQLGAQLLIAGVLIACVVGLLLGVSLGRRTT